MKKNYIIWSIVSAVMMILLPLATLTWLDRANRDITYILILNYINPIYAFIVGYSAGKNIKSMWGLPVISVLLFLISVIIEGEFWESSHGLFLTYAGIYLVISVLIMLISSLIRLAGKVIQKKSCAINSDLL